MLKAFNSLQIVAAYAAAPYGIQWLSQAEFPGHTAALWAGVVGYCIFSLAMVASVYIAVDREL